MNKAEAKPYALEEKNSSILDYYFIMYVSVLHDSKVFLLLNALYTSKTIFFRARSFCVAKSNANRNSHGLMCNFVR